MARSYRTIKSYANGIFSDRGSKFFSYIHPIITKEEAYEWVKFYREDQPTGRHHCYAYRIGIDGKEHRSNDDGEPSGTAGKPILNQLLSKKITNVVVVVVRYSSGTKLGIPRLINAYKEATINALNMSEIIKKVIARYFRLQCTYAQIPEVIKWSKQQKVEFTKQKFDLQCFIEFAIESEISDTKLATLSRNLNAEFLFEG